MRVYQIRIKLYFLQDVSLSKMQTKLTLFLDKGFANDDMLMKKHKENTYKNYCYDLPYPVEKDKVYKKDNIYTVTIRTIDVVLAKYFHEVCVNSFTNEMKGLTAEICIIPQKTIEFLYSLTPAVLKDDRGYWKHNMSIDQYEDRLKINLIKKWNVFTGEKLEEDFQFITFLEFLNEGPVPIKYKDIKLLGDKLRIQIADNVSAQRLAYMALGTGILEMNSRGSGYVNYHWL